MPILQFLERALPTVGAVAGGVLGGAADVASLGALAPVINPITGAAAGSALGRVGENALTKQSLGSGVAQSAIGGAVGQGVGGLAANALGDTLGTGLTGAFTKGATVGGSSSAASTAAMGDRSGKDLTMSFLQGAAIGGVTGGAVQSVAKRFFSQDKLDKMATSENTSQIEKDITPVTGPVVAQRIAPAIAKSNDSEIVSNIIDNGVKEHLPSPPPQTPIQDVTPVTKAPETAGQGTEPPDFLKPDNPSAVSDIEAQRTALDMMHRDADPADALRYYMDATGKPFPEARDTINSLVKKSTAPLGNNTKGAISSEKNPLFGQVENPEAQRGDTETPIRNARTTNNEIFRRVNAALEQYDKLSPNDQQLADRLRGTDPAELAKEAENPEQFQSFANQVKQYNDYTQAKGAELGQNVGYKKYYGAPILTVNADEEMGMTPLELAKYHAQQPTKPGYGMERTTSGYDEATAGNRQRLFENFGQDLAYDAERRSNHLMSLELEKGLNEALPGQVKTGMIGPNYRQLDIPGGSRISLPSDIANEINRRAPAFENNGLVRGYDTINSELKNLKLGGGAFHSLNVLGTYIGRGLGSGDILRPSWWGDLNGIMKGTFSGDAYKSELDRMSQSGTLMNADAAGLTHDLKTVQADVQGGPLANKIPGLGQLHDAIFGRQIPLLKLKTFEQMTQGLDRNNPEDLQKMVSTAKELNQNYGGLNREIQGLTPQTFKRTARLFLATDYNEGQIRTLVDAFSKGGVEGKLARQVVFGKALLFGGIAAAGGVAGGEFQGQTPKQIALNLIQKVVNPKFQAGGFTASLPTTQLSELGKPVSETVSNALAGRTVKTPWENFASARLAAVPSFAEQNVSNKNFYGQPIHGTDFYGRPVTPGQTVANEIGSLSPIPVTQAIQAGEGRATPASVAANIAGLNVRPNNSIQYAPIYGQTYLQALQKTPGIPKDQIQADQQFFAALGSTGGKKKVETQAAKDFAAGDEQKAQQDIAAYNVKLLKALKPWSQSDGAKYFDQTMQSILQSSLIKMSTIRNNVTYTKKTNPTSIGLPINALQGGQ